MHELGIVHRDLKPQNVLISKEMILSAKLSDMGISKRMSGDMSSLGHLATGEFFFYCLCSIPILLDLYQSRKTELTQEKTT